MLPGVDALIDMSRTSVNVVGHWAGQGAAQEKLAAALTSPEPL